MEFTRYKRSTGEIVSVGEVAESDVPLQAMNNGYAVIAGQKIDASAFYIKNRQPEPRPVVYPHREATIVGDGVDELVIDGVPERTEVHLDGKRIGKINDGVLIYVSIEPGEHWLWLRPPTPWQDQHIRVTVT